MTLTCKLHLIVSGLHQMHLLKIGITQVSEPYRKHSFVWMFPTTWNLVVWYPSKCVDKKNSSQIVGRTSTYMYDVIMTRSIHAHLVTLCGHHSHIDSACCIKAKMSDTYETVWCGNWLKHLPQISTEIHAVLWQSDYVTVFIVNFHKWCDLWKMM